MWALDESGWRGRGTSVVGRYVGCTGCCLLRKELYGSSHCWSGPLCLVRQIKDVLVRYLLSKRGQEAGSNAIIEVQDERSITAERRRCAACGV